MEKKFSHIFYLLTGVVFLSLLSSCLKERITEHHEDNLSDESGLYTNFDFHTISTHTIELDFLNGTAPIEGVYLELYISAPLDERGVLNAEIAESCLYRGITGSNGSFQCKINPPSCADSIYILVRHIGIQALYTLPLDAENIYYEINAIQSAKKSLSVSGKKLDVIPETQQFNDFYILGNWSSDGVPEYLEPEDDIISNEFYEDVNASLPEYKPLTESHPQYLSAESEASLDLIENCEVWVTMVHEGAGWQNSLGYYTYPTDSPPQSREEIKDLTIIFPNYSIFYKGLNPGNKVQLFYLDPETAEYTDIFPANRSVGWFLIGNGWSNSQNAFTSSIIHFSNPDLNTEDDKDLRQHNVILYDLERELLLIGFEDLIRDQGGCDNDFNDAVFYTTVSPVTAVDNTQYQPVDNPEDSDNDGTSDVFDDYPEDPDLSFNNYYPAEGIYGTLAFEDLWPYKGDYDFNDLVVDYNYNQVTNSRNEIISIHASIVPRALGASFRNAFGIELNVSPEKVSSVSGQQLNQDYLSINQNGTENQQENAVIIFFDDGYNVLPFPGGSLYVNTDPEGIYVESDTLKTDILFTEPVSVEDVVPPYNPFMIVNKERGKEIHLPTYPPTSLADPSLFGTGHDKTDLAEGTYYMSDKYLPWCLNFPSSFTYPCEKENIMESYIWFNTWALSRGEEKTDWYYDIEGYRINSKLYNKQ